MTLFKLAIILFDCLLVAVGVTLVAIVVRSL